MGAMPKVPFVRSKPPIESRVADELRHDLAEAERDDGEVVAAQAQRRQADQDADDRREHPGEDQDEPHRDVDPGEAVATPSTRGGHVTWPNCCEASQPAMYAPAA